MPVTHTPPSESSLAPVAVVTGAARGIGLAVVKWFIAQGYRVALIDVDNASLQAAASRLGDQTGALALHCDVSDPAQVQTAIDKVAARFGRIDALVNNAGVAVFKPIGETSFEEWRTVMATNLDGAYLCSQACVPVMHGNGGGAIVNIASISGLRASTLRVAYGTSKAALIHLTKQQAAELGTIGIRANAIAPGPVETENGEARFIRLPSAPTITTRFRSGDTETLEEIASAIGFLCSPAAGYINGQVIAVDGGFEASGIGLPTLRRDAARARLTRPIGRARLRNRCSRALY